tara:strand:+ start:192 stop:1643 length:1452 start_codon:yes stop_codon:yes gene_type:complete
LKQLLLLGILSILSFNLKAQDKTLKDYKIPEFENKEYFGTKIPRTMSLLENSTKHISQDLKIQFYGQSIIGGLDQNLIINKLKEKYPTVKFNVIKNPIGGFTAPSLARVAIHDLYHEYADLIIFHVYGGDKSGDLENIFMNIKQKTTAEVIVFNHHIAYAGEDKEAQKKRTLSDFYGSKSIELLANKYNFEFVDVRKAWENFISLNSEINIKSLLKDGVHPNKLGNELLAYCILQHFKYNPYIQFINSSIYDIQFKDTVNNQLNGLRYKGDYKLSNYLELIKDSELSFNFIGNKIDIIPSSENKDSQIEILINGIKPSEINSLYYITRPTSNYKMWWPAIKRVSLSKSKAPVIQKYTLEIFNIDRESKTFSFKLYGNKSGFDGEGNNKENFLSNSKLISINKNDFTIFQSERVSKKETPENFKVTFEIKSLAKDNISISNSNQITLFKGIENELNNVTIKVKKGKLLLDKIRIYKPQKTMPNN